MKICFEKQQEISLNNVSYGDVIVLKNGSKWLIVCDYDGEDYVGVNLETSRITDVGFSIREFLEGEILEGVVDDNGYSCEVERIIKSEDLVLGVK